MFAYIDSGRIYLENRLAIQFRLVEYNKNNSRNKCTFLTIFELQDRFNRFRITGSVQF